METDLRLTVLGARGSIPVSRRDCGEFGGSTSCYMVQACGETIFLDAGSGLVSAPAEFDREPVILLSHMHLDHILGLGMYPRLSKAGTKTRLLLRAKSIIHAQKVLSALYSPPFWPLPLTEYAGAVELAPLSPSFRIGQVLVETMEGRHPGGCLIFRISCGNKRLVYATDYEPDDASFSALISFCSGVDLILYDAQYTPEAYPQRKGFGHSYAEKGIELLERSGAGRLLLIHHSPYAADEELLAREQELGRENVRYAREGEVIVL